jgi:predicted enzyme related to lactoylglutathione lyase
MWNIGEPREAKTGSFCWIELATTDQSGGKDFSHWMPYYRAADCAASCRMAAQLGAKTLMPATPMPKVGTIAVLADPQGGAFSLFQSML